MESVIAILVVFSWIGVLVAMSIMMARDEIWFDPVLDFLLGKKPKQEPPASQDT